MNQLEWWRLRYLADQPPRFRPRRGQSLGAESRLPYIPHESFPGAEPPPKCEITRKCKRCNVEKSVDDFRYVCRLPGGAAANRPEPMPRSILVKKGEQLPPGGTVKVQAGWNYYPYCRECESELRAERRGKAEAPPRMSSEEFREILAKHGAKIRQYIAAKPKRETGNPDWHAPIRAAMWDALWRSETGLEWADYFTIARRAAWKAVKQLRQEERLQEKLYAIYVTNENSVSTGSQTPMRRRPEEEALRDTPMDRLSMQLARENDEGRVHDEPDEIIKPFTKIPEAEWARRKQLFERSAGRGNLWIVSWRPFTVARVIGPPAVWHPHYHMSRFQREWVAEHGVTLPKATREDVDTKATIGEMGHPKWMVKFGLDGDGMFLYWALMLETGQWLAAPREAPTFYYGSRRRASPEIDAIQLHEKSHHPKVDPVRWNSWLRGDTQFINQAVEPTDPDEEGIDWQMLGYEDDSDLDDWLD